MAIVEQQLGHPVPRPRETAPVGQSQLEGCLIPLRHWLAALDLAVGPPQLREALKDDQLHETCEALLRYFLTKPTYQETDRDKADCVITFLYKHPRYGATHNREVPDDGSEKYGYIMQLVLEFETEIYRMLGDMEVPALAPEHSRLLQEFEFLYHEIDDLRTFDQLTDCGIIQRVRTMKQKFGRSFFHMDVLANVAVYNTIFGRKFDELFRAATSQIKTYADTVQTQGGSIHSRVDSDVTVQHLAEVQQQEQHIVRKEYGQAQEEFRKIAKYRKAVDKSRGGRTAAVGPSPSASPGPAPAAAPRLPSAGSPAEFREALRQAPAPAPVKKEEIVPAAAAAPPMIANAQEEGKTRIQLDTMRTFVRAADPRSHTVVPLGQGVVMVLTQTEAECLRAEFGEEKSFRADYASAVANLVGVIARITIEQNYFKHKQQSQHLWKPHADGLSYLIQSAKPRIEAANQVLGTSEQRGLDEKSNALKATILKLRMAMQESEALLASLAVAAQ